MVMREGIVGKVKEDNQIIEEMTSILREKARELYPEKVVDYGSNPANYGTIDSPDGYAIMPDECGKDVEMFLRIRQEKVDEAKFIAGGCIFTVAACNAAAEMARGKTWQECLSINISSIVEHLGGMPEDHLHCALFAARIFQRTLKSYIIKKSRGQGAGERTE